MNLKLVNTGNLNSYIWVKQAPPLWPVRIKTPIWSVDWRGMERNKYSPWGRKAY